MVGQAVPGPGVAGVFGVFFADATTDPVRGGGLVGEGGDAPAVGGVDDGQEVGVLVADPDRSVVAGG